MGLRRFAILVEARWCCWSARRAGPGHWASGYRRVMMRVMLVAMVVASIHPAAVSR
jgi:hypothetical protein